MSIMSSEAFHHTICYAGEVNGVTSANIMDPGMSLELLHSEVAVHEYKGYY